MADLDFLLKRIEALEARVQALSAAQSPSAAPMAPPEVMDRPTGRNSRRAMLTAAAATLGALGLAGSAGSPPPADAAPARATADNMKVGQDNTPSTNADVTRLLNPTAGTAHNLLLHADNRTGSTTAMPANSRVSLAGTNTIAATAGQDQIGVFAHATNGYGLYAQAVWPILLSKHGTSGVFPTTVGSNTVAEGALAFAQATGVAGSDEMIFRTSNGWRRVVGDFSAGLLYPFGPVRVLDTRPAPDGPIGFDQNGNPITSGPFTGADETRSYRIAGKTFQNPTTTFNSLGQLRGLLLNITVLQTGGGGGFVAVFRADLAATPPTVSNLNPSDGITSNFACVRVPTAADQFQGNIAVRVAGGVPRHVILDVFAVYLT